MAANIEDADKRKRSSNWDSSEISLLRQLVQENLVMIRSKLTNFVTNAKKNAVWRSIAGQINALGLHCRSEKEVKTKWQNLQTSAKKMYADNQKYSKKTGGGPAPKPINSETEQIVDMMKDCSSFVGLGGYETAVLVEFQDESQSGKNMDNCNETTQEAVNSISDLMIFNENLDTSKSESSSHNSTTFLSVPVSSSTPCCTAKSVRKSTKHTITQEMLMQKQYDVLSVQEEKFKLEIEQIKLQNVKLQMEIRRLSQWEIQEQDAAIALDVLNV